MVYTYLISEELNWTSDMDSEMDRLHKASLFASSTSINLLSVEITVVAALSGNIQPPHTCLQENMCASIFGKNNSPLCMFVRSCQMGIGDLSVLVVSSTRGVAFM